MARRSTASAWCAGMAHDGSMSGLPSRAHAVIAADRNAAVCAEVRQPTVVQINANATSATTAMRDFAKGNRSSPTPLRTTWMEQTANASSP